MSALKSIILTICTLSLLSLMAAAPAWAGESQSAVGRDDNSAGSKDAFMPTGEGQTEGQQPNQATTQTGSPLQASADQTKPHQEDNQDKPPDTYLQNQQQQQTVMGPNNLTGSINKGYGSGATALNPFGRRLHEMATGGFFDELSESDIFPRGRNSDGARGSGGGGGPIGNGPGAQMYYENHMPGDTPKRPTNPLALPNQYNFSGPTAAKVTSGFSASIPGMHSLLPSCCQSKLPCCMMNLRCCDLMKKPTQNKGGGGGGGGGGNSFSGMAGGNPATGGSSAMTGAFTAQFGLEMATKAGATFHQVKSNGSQKQGSGGGSKGEGALEDMDDSFSMMLDYLINVANENAGSPTSADAVSKTYSNAVWMVQQMYKNVYMQIAILLVLPGALLTNIKSIVGFNFLNLKDEDTLSPFTGIQRSIIAIFLIPATQLFVSYVIDTANALSGAVSQEVHISTIETWAKEQIQTFEGQQQGDMIKNLPIVPRAPWRGKAASMPKTLAMLEQMSYCDISLCEAINQCVMALSIAAIVFNVFQITFMCYLYLMGPITAAFFAWPGVGRELFRKAFSSWMDGVVILALWKFWWDIVLLCWGVWIENGHGNPFELVNGYYCIGWLCLLMFVPFNPFDFKVGEIVSTVLAKAEGAAAAGAKKGAQGAKKGGGPGPGGGGGGGGGG